MEPESNPYAAPAGELREAPFSGAAPELWNPNAAALWSLLFSPVFGAFLQMRNWQALGEPDKARASWYWVLATIAILLVAVVMAFVLPDAHWFNKITDRSGMIVLLTWYLTNGKLQVAYVKERYGKDYPRKGWGAPLGIAFGAVLALLLLVVGATVVLSTLGLVQLP